jgi:hypothetical protein
MNIIASGMLKVQFRQAFKNRGCKINNEPEKISIFLYEFNRLFFRLLQSCINMSHRNRMHFLCRICLVMLAGCIFTLPGLAQDNYNEAARYLYHPQHSSVKNDSVQKTSLRAEQMQNNSAVTEAIYQQDTSAIDSGFVEDSLNDRLRFLEDSLLAREIFVRDSIERRQRIKDSLNILLTQLPRLLDATFKAFSDEIIFRNNSLKIIGDSVLSSYESIMLTFDFSSAFTPWKSVLSLSCKETGISLNPESKRITAIQAPNLNCSYIYGNNENILVILTKGSIISRASGKLYKEPVDSVFFDRQGRVIKVKKYVQFYNVVNNYQRGSKLFIHLAYVKQFEYNPGGEMVLCEVTRFCDRWQQQDLQKVCNIISYSIKPQGSVCYITRKNNPPNDFSDGTFTYEFAEGNTLSAVSFENDKKTENWKTIIEVNEKGNVSRYLYQSNGAIHKTLLVNYYLDDPKAKNKVETITCIFEDDGISYFQQNNTTGKSRSRDKLTLEWSDWK